jgi:hypothetical protein
MRRFLCILIVCSLTPVLFCQDKNILITDTSDTKSITKKVFEIQEVEIKATVSDANLKSGSTGIEVDIKQIRLLPKFVGESDPYKALQYMGGVSQSGEANSGLYVRGGNNDQNLIMLNGAMIQNPTHVLGMFSAFNSDLIGQMRFVKSGMPAEYGGRLSSVVDINTNNNIPEKTDLTGSIGLISSRISTHVPISSRFSVFASWRGSYISSIILPGLTLLGVDSLLTQNKYEFWDTNVGFIYNISPKTKFSGHFYTGKDDLKIQELKKFDMQENATFWQNTAAGLQLNHIFNDHHSTVHQLNLSKFHIQSAFEWYNSLQELQSQFQNLNYKADFFRITGNHQLKYGTELSYNGAVPHFVRTDSILPIEVNDERNQIYSAQATAYFRDEWTWKKWQINAGLRANIYAHLGPYTDFGEQSNSVYEKNKNR